MVSRLIVVALLAGFNLAQADVAAGEQLYKTAGGFGCAVCHGLLGEGAGQAGGYIRGTSLQALNDSLLTNPPMQPLSGVLSDADRATLVEFLKALAQRPLLSAKYQDGQWQGEMEPWENGDTIDLVLYNTTFDTVELQLPKVSNNAIVIAPLATFTWRGQITDLQQDFPGFTW